MVNPGKGDSCIHLEFRKLQSSLTKKSEMTGRLEISEVTPKVYQLNYYEINEASPFKKDTFSAPVLKTDAR